MPILAILAQSRSMCSVGRMCCKRDDSRGTGRTRSHDSSSSSKLNVRRRWGNDFCDNGRTTSVHGRSCESICMASYKVWRRAARQRERQLLPCWRTLALRRRWTPDDQLWLSRRWTDLAPPRTP